LSGGADPGIDGPAQRLNASLHEADNDGHNVELVALPDEGGPDGECQVDGDGDEDGSFGSDLRPQVPESYGRRESDELRDQQGHDEVVGLETD